MYTGTPHSIRHLWLLIIVLTLMTCQATEPRLTRLFRNLESGEKQTVVAYGTSLTLSGSWATATREWFATNYPGQVTFINSSGSGMNSDWGVSNLQTKVLAYKPALVLVEFSFNDAHTKFGLTPAQAWTNLSAIAQGIHEQDTETTVLLQVMNVPWDAPNNPALTSRPRLELFNDNYRQFARADRVPLIDHYPAWTALQRTNPALYRKYIPDGAHPTEAASRAVTWPAVRDWLEASRRLTIQRIKAESTFQSADRMRAGQKAQADICVYGGTSGGVIAAVQAARMGKSVILVSPTKHLGGLTSSGLGWTDFGSEEILGGLSRSFYHRLYLHYQRAAAWKWQSSNSFANVGQNGPAFNHVTELASVFEPHVTEQIYHQMLAEYAIPVVHGLLDLTNGVTMERGRITAIRTEDGAQFRAKMFIDASYEGDLMAKAGVTYTIGREANATYGETQNGIQAAAAVKNQLPDGIDPYVIPGNPASGLLPGVNPDAGGADGTADNKLQAFCYRIVLTDVAANRLPVPKPEGYREADYELLFRTIAAGQSGQFYKFALMPNRKTDGNNASGMSTDFIGANYRPGWNWAEATHAEREKSAREHELWQRGLIWTLQNHPNIPAAIRNAYSRWGLPADEFTDNGNWPYQIYVREARRMVSDYVMTEANCSHQAVAADSIGLAAYTMDSHNTQRYVRNGMVKNEGDIQFAIGGPYPVSYRSIVPRKGQCENLLVPWCLSASHIAFGSIRMEPVFMILSQSAATAAALAIDDNISVQALDYQKLAAVLRADGQKLHYGTEELSDIVVDNTVATATPASGWSPSTATSGFYGLNYLHDGNTNKGSKEVRYTPSLPAAGQYQVYLRWPQQGNRSTKVPVVIYYNGGFFSTNINERAHGNTWNLLGSFPFAAGTNGYLLLGTRGTTDGYVIADAAMWRNDRGERRVNVVPAGATFLKGQLPYPRFIFTRSGNTSFPLEIKYQVSGTATPGVDFSPLAGTFVIPAGVTDGALGIRTLANLETEPAETITLALTPDSAYVLGDNKSATIVIKEGSKRVLSARQIGPAGTASARMQQTQVEQLSWQHNHHTTESYRAELLPNKD